ncbi:MAG: hypothetical protein KDA88_14215 [Planctomycetaceae bacterium]|nr:hypothetical protein [Planctomycetaceae bacterium]
MRRQFQLLFAFAALTSVTTVRAADVDYVRDVQPIFKKYCTGCHNDAEPEGKVSLESFKSLQQGNPDGPNVLPGDPANSLLVRLIRGQDEPQMPPEDEERPTDKELALIEAWIEGGAKGPEGAAPDRMQLIVPEIGSLTDRRPISAVAISPGGDALAVARYAEVTLYRKLRGDGEDRKKLTWQPVQTLTDFRGKVTAVHFVSGGGRLLTASGVTGLGGVATIWEWPLNRKVREFVGHRDLMYDAELSRDGKVLATCSYDREIQLWNAQTGEPLRTLSGHNGAVYDIAFSPDGEFLVSASADDTCKVWRVADGTRMDTLGQPLKEEYCVAFSPDGRRIVAGGADNNLRVWDFVSRDKPRINPVAIARFAHEGPVLNLEFTNDGKHLVTIAEDRTIKVWETQNYTEAKLWENEPEVADALAVSPDGKEFVVGRMDGALNWVSLKGIENSASGNVHAGELATTIPAAAERSKAAEQEPNNAAENAQVVQAPADITGVIDGMSEGKADVDLYRFSAKAGEEWVIETNAARSKSPLDTFVEVLTADGQRIERVQLQAVRDSYFTFRGKDANQSNDFRVFNWEEMELNEYFYANGEVVRLWLYPRGPDSGFNVYPGTGNRWSYFDTTSLSHALGEPGYIVQPHAPEEALIPNGLPVFKLYYENDDECRRALGSDSRVYFTAPADGDYIAKVKDVRGFQSPDHKYTLTIRPRQPDFKGTLHNGNPQVSAGSGKEFKVSVERLDQFDGPVEVNLGGELPLGFSVTSPVIIEAGQTEAYGVISAAPDAPAPTPENSKLTKVTASASIRGEQIEHDVNNFGEIKLAEKPKVIPRIVSVDGAAGAEGPLEVVLHPGETIRLKVQVERDGFDGEVKFGNEFSGRNLPHGTFIDNIGLNGLMLLTGQNERDFFITCAPWVPEQSREFHLETGEAGGQATNSVIVHVKRD